MYFKLSCCLFSDFKRIISLGISVVIKTIWSFRCSTNIAVLLWRKGNFLLVFVYFDGIWDFILCTRLNLHMVIRTVSDFNFWRKSVKLLHWMASVDLRNVVSFTIKIKVSVDIIMFCVDILTKHCIDGGDIIVVWIATSLPFTNKHVRLLSNLPEFIFNLDGITWQKSWPEAWYFWKSLIIFLVDLTIRLSSCSSEAQSAFHSDLLEGFIHFEVFGEPSILRLKTTRLTYGGEFAILDIRGV